MSRAGHPDRAASLSPEHLETVLIFHKRGLQFTLMMKI